MSALTSKHVSCPICGKRFTDRGLQNHVNAHKNVTVMEKKMIRLIRRRGKHIKSSLN